ncbi:hypothetical protein NliqN6_4516 [Naganishia liquefaciens]|uniref:Zinc finger C2H2 LYAR-type domain-containing protein n=1 Tax=Naganishia liquefaciens TaxID=104408 RepID=A0A8H3TXS2_9TREE|nr:hypothetical protein NliqN6_4516 [Naganishia liquefaciens]
MVSFQCDGCGDTIKKPQLDKHRNRCWSTFSCIDCSTTFHGTDYKSHTSCISEAEKYQGALYKGKKAGHAGNNAKNSDQNGRYQPYPTSKPKPQDATPDTSGPVTAEPTPEPTSSAPAPTIHPSRTALLNGTHDPTFRPRPARAGFPSLHPGANYPPPKPFGRKAQQQAQMQATKNYATGMNGMSGGEMRSWGGSPEVAAAEGGEAAPVVELSTEKISVGVPVDDGMGEKKKKNKKKKGDKGGCGSRANSNLSKRAEAADAAAAAATASPAEPAAPAASTAESGDAVKAKAEAPAVIIPATPLATEAQATRDSKKKRKAEVEPATETDAPDASSSSSSKTAKKLRKALSSIASSQPPAAGSVPLASLIEQISEQVSKKKKSDGVIDPTAITQDIKVKFVQTVGEEGRWVLEV